MALTRMTLHPAAFRAPPSYNSVAADALSSRFIQLNCLLFFVAAGISFILAFFLNSMF